MTRNMDTIDGRCNLIRRSARSVAAFSLVTAAPSSSMVTITSTAASVTSAAAPQAHKWSCVHSTAGQTDNPLERIRRSQRRSLLVA